MATQVVTANRLSDGRVVYLAADGSWCLTVERAAIAADAAAAEALLAEAARAEAAQKVVGAYAIEVEAGEGPLRPLRYRERIRALGPSVRRDLGKQAEPQETASR